MIKLILGSLFFISISYAQDCADERKTFCSHIPPGQGQIMKCLEDNESQLGAQCKKDLKEFKNKTLKANPCFEDLADFCGEIDPQGGRLNLCLLKNESKLSDTCNKDFKKKKPQIIKDDPCAEDVVSSCYDKVGKEEGFVTRCLFKNVAKLKAACQIKVKSHMTKMKLANPCFDETEKFCPDMVKIYDIDLCLAKNQKQLGPKCAEVIKHEQELSAKNPCHQDVKKHCRQGISLDGVNRCLELNEKTLSSECTAHQKAHKDKISKRVTACEEDRKKFCDKVEAKGGLILKCLKENKAKISKSCSDVL